MNGSRLEAKRMAVEKFSQLNNAAILGRVKSTNMSRDA
jgi:hypothetical protein